uniref:Uncharacterized protein n=1 Tax=Globodera rostochiensis TaxID=31243 RepID=A0A914H9F7_GLORO
MMIHYLPQEAIRWYQCQRNCIVIDFNDYILDTNEGPTPINLCPCVSPSRAIPHLCCGSTLAESVAETAMGELEMTHTAGAGGAATDRLDGPA